MSAGERADDRAERGRENGAERGPRKPYGKWIADNLPGHTFTVRDMVTILQKAGHDADEAGTARAIHAAVKGGNVARVGRGLYKGPRMKVKKAKDPKPAPTFSYLGTSQDGLPLLIDPKGRIGVFVLFEVNDA